MILEQCYVLPGGVRIPKIGLGTWLIPDEQAADAVRAAVKAGYRHIDSAQAYGNERGVGEGIRTCGVPREELFLTTKVAAEIKDYHGAVASIDESLRKLDIGWIDLVIIHCPQPWAEFRSREKRYFEENKQVWKALEEAYEAGKVRAIGVSNFLEEELEDLLPSCRIRPMINQFKLHIGCTDMSLVEYCRRQGIMVESYSPIAHGDALGKPEIQKMAAKYGVSVPQLCIRYTLQLGTVSLPKSVNPTHMASNAAVDFEISEEDMAALIALQA